MSENDWLEESAKPTPRELYDAVAKDMQARAGITPMQDMCNQALRAEFTKMLMEKDYDPAWVTWDREWGEPPLPPETPLLCRISGNDDDTIYGAVGEIQWAHASIDRIRIVPNHRFGEWQQNDGSGDTPELEDDDDPWVHVQTNEGWAVDTCSTYYWSESDEDEESYVKRYRVLERPFGEDEEESEARPDGNEAFIMKHVDSPGDVGWAISLDVKEHTRPVDEDCSVIIYTEEGPVHGYAGEFWWGVSHREGSTEILSYSVEEWAINPEQEYDNPGAQPVPNGTRVQVLLRNYYGTWRTNDQLAERYAWDIDGNDGDIMKYRILAEPGA